MSLFSKTASAALVAATLMGATFASSTAAEARRGHFWGGFAVGAATGLIVSHAYQPYYGGHYYRPACHWEWHHGYYGPRRVKVCY